MTYSESKKKLEEMKQDYDWQQAFGYAKPQPIIFEKDISTDPFTMNDIDWILYVDEGQNDGPDWIGVFRLKDGRYASLSAGCDYTGWDCQAGGGAYVSKELSGILSFGLTKDMRDRFGIKWEPYEPEFR